MKNHFGAAVSFPAALIRFGRVHTLVATSVQTLALYAFVAAGAPRPLAAIVPAAALAACLCANLYVVGLNQLTDVRIDRVNKPDLPLAHGDLTPGRARAIVATAGAAALALGAAQSVFLLLTLAVVMLIGTAYSLPPLRLKGRPAAAALSIALARGVVATLGLYLHYARALGRPIRPLPATLLGALLFFFGFGLVIALFKDIPDQAGDRQYGIGTFAVRWGRRQVFALGRGLLTALYLLPAAAWLLNRAAAPAPLLIAVHLALLGAFWLYSRRTDPAQPASMLRLYFLLWTLFYVEYALLAASRTTG